MDENIKELSDVALTYPGKAAVFEIKDDATVRKANDFLLMVKGFRKKINDTFDPIIEAAHRTHKRAIAQKREIERPLVEAEAIVKPKIGSYLREQMRKRQEAEEEARRAAAEAERKKKEKEEAALKAALEAEAENNTELAEKIIEEASIPEAVAKPLIPGKMKLEGTHIRQYWKWEVVDISKVPEEFLVQTVDKAMVEATIKRNKEKTSIPGIRVFLETIPITKI